MKKIVHCRVCQSHQIVNFLDLGNQPYANSLLNDPQTKEKMYPLSLSYCKHCSLVQLNHTASPRELFSNYVWVTSTSSVAKKHAEVFCKNILSKINSLKTSYILEVASNDGTFLQPFIKKKYKALGVDPAQNIVDIAVSHGVDTKCAFFGLSYAEKIRKERGQATVVIARNVLPHVADVHDFVQGMHVMLSDGGLLVIEFHYAKKIYEELHYDSIYHEHLCYFTLKSIEKLLSKYKLFIEDIKISPISGGSLVIYARKGKRLENKIVKEYRQREVSIRLNSLESWRKFSDRVENHRHRLLKFFHQNKKAMIVGYGASARSSTLLNYCGINSTYISVIADQNRLKQGLYTAGSHILIQSPDNVMKKHPDIVVLLAWNFGLEIITSLHNNYNYKGMYLIPLPNNPKVLAL